MGFYVTTENPNVMMKENHNTQSCEYIILCQDGLYIASTTPEEILHMLEDKYKIRIYLQDKYPHDPGHGTSIMDGRCVTKYCTSSNRFIPPANVENRIPRFIPPGNAKNMIPGLEMLLEAITLWDSTSKP